MSTDITMTFEEFCDEVVGYFEEKYPEATVTIKKVTKNNGLILTGLTVQKGESVLPVIYLERYWKLFRTNKDLPNVFKEIDKALSSKIEFPESFSLENLKDFDKMKNWLCLRAVNKEKNTELLKGMPYITVLDLAITFYIYLGNGASIQVNDGMLEGWKISKEDFIKEYIPIALANTNRILPCTVFNMVQFIDSIVNTTCEEKECVQDLMYVVTNPAKYYGAAAIATEGMKFREFGEKHGGFYIIPSSVHELIFVVGEHNRKDSKSLYRMVREVNRTMVDPDEVLSDNVYYFDPSVGYPVIAE